MVLDNFAPFDAAQVLTSFAADLTDAASLVAERHGICGSWIDLQLDVWKVLAATATQRERAGSRAPTAPEYLEWRERFLSELTDAAYQTTLRHGLQGPFLEIELDLYRALRVVFERLQSSAGLRFIFGARAWAITNAVLARLEQQAERPVGADCCHA